MSNPLQAGMGFQPIEFPGSTLRIHKYAVPTANTIGFYIGDLVQANPYGSTSGIVTAKYGWLRSVKMDVVITTTDGATHHVLGTVVGIQASNGDVLSYLPPATTGDGTVAGYLSIADDPDQLLEACGDGVFTAAAMSYNYEVTPGTLNAGNTTTGLSTMMIKSASGDAVTATIPIKLLYQSRPQEDVITAAYCRMVCMINPACHEFGNGTAI